MIAIICSVFAYIIMGLIILVEDYTVWHDCDNTSELWPYCLVAILLFWNKLAARNAINNEENNNDTAFIISTITCCILIELGLAIWGAVELFDEKTCCTSNHSKNFVNGTCHELTTTPLWTFGLATNILSWIVICAFLILIIVIVIYAACDRQKAVVGVAANFHHPPSPYPHTSGAIPNVSTV